MVQIFILNFIYLWIGFFCLSTIGAEQKKPNPQKPNQYSINAIKQLGSKTHAYNLEYLYGFKKTSFKNHKQKTAAEVIFWLQQYAKKQDHIAQHIVHNILLRGGNKYDTVQKQYKKIYSWYHRAYVSGDKIAQFMFGIIHELGLNGSKDSNKAISLFKQSFTKESEFMLGYIYQKNKQYKKSLYWYTQSAKQGYKMSQYNLGYLYYEGIGITQDKKKSLYWYNKFILKN